MYPRWRQHFKILQASWHPGVATSVYMQVTRPIDLDLCGSYRRQDTRVPSPTSTITLRRFYRFIRLGKAEHFFPGFAKCWQRIGAGFKFKVQVCNGLQFRVQEVPGGHRQFSPLIRSISQPISRSVFSIFLTCVSRISLKAAISCRSRSVGISPSILRTTQPWPRLRNARRSVISSIAMHLP